MGRFELFADGGLGRFASRPEDRPPMPSEAHQDPNAVWHPQVRAWGTFAQGDCVFYPGVFGGRACDRYRTDMTNARIAVGTSPTCLDGLRAESCRHDMACALAERDALRAVVEDLRDGVTFCDAGGTWHVTRESHCGTGTTLAGAYLNADLLDEAEAVERMR